MKTVRIGGGAGFSGDRADPGLDLIRRGGLDYIVFECLAERSLALAQLERRQQPGRGYHPDFESRITGILRAVREHPVKVITNMGAAHPEKAAEVCRTIAEAEGMRGLKIAAVTGDDVLDKASGWHSLATVETGFPLAQSGRNMVSANAYMGSSGITQALRQGADIVITGRVADPSLVLGALIHAFGWKNDQWHLLGQGTAAGHLLECAGQVTGGYFCDPGVKPAERLWELGFPIAEVSEDGRVIITKLPDTGGVVSVQTCREQLMYEIGDPGCYMTPDCAISLLEAEVFTLGKDRVEVRGIRGMPGNGAYKVSVGFQDHWMGEGSISYGGSTAGKRAALAGEIVAKRLKIRGCQLEALKMERLGVDALFGPRISREIASGQPAEVRLRVAGRAEHLHDARMVCEEVEALYTNGPGGGGGVFRHLREVISLASVLVPASEIKPVVRMLEVGI